MEQGRQVGHHLGDSQHRLVRQHGVGGDVARHHCDAAMWGDGPLGQVAHMLPLSAVNEQQSLKIHTQIYLDALVWSTQKRIIK